MNGKQVRREILNCLNTLEWKSAGEIRQEIEKNANKDVHQPQIYSGLVILESLQKIERKVENAGTKKQRSFYRKKLGGRKARFKFTFFGWLRPGSQTA